MMRPCLVAFCALFSIASQSPVPATTPDLVLLAAHGVKGGVQTTGVINGYHSGDFQVPVTLQPPAPDGTSLRLVWCYKQNGVPITFPGMGSYLTTDPGQQDTDATGAISYFTAILPFGYRLFGSNGVARNFPSLPAGSYELECFVGDDAVMQVSPPSNYWGSVVFPVDVVDQPVVVAIPDHRNLIFQSEVMILVTRNGATTDSSAYNLDIIGDAESVELTSSLAIIPENATSTLVGLKLHRPCEFRVLAANVEDSPQADSGYSCMGRVGDPIRGPYDCMPVPDGRPRPFPNNTIYEGSVSSRVLKAGGALPAGANPLIFCGECSPSPGVPPECAGDPTGQAFVENGRCTSEWNWWPYGNGNSCVCHYEQVKSAKYVMTAGALPTSCPLGASLSHYIGFSFEPSRICCTWNRIPGQDMPGEHQVLICKDFVVPAPQ